MEVVIMVALEPLGDRAFLAHFATEAEAARWVASVRTRAVQGVTDVVLAYNSAAVFADPDRADLENMESQLSAIEPGPAGPIEGKLLVIPVLYDGADLELVGSRLDLGAADVIALHTSIVFHVFAIGFLPGFPYTGYLPRELSGLPRRDEPRLCVPAGAVAIAGRQTGVYPHESPGGWHLLGRTPLLIADAASGYFPIRSGDRIQFQAIDPAEFEARRHERL
jgi:KipI family sensor histidine kinase inhibitor